MVLSYPRTRVAKEGERPNIVQQFISTVDGGVAKAMILTKRQPYPTDAAISEDELREIFSPDEMKDMVPSGAVFINGNRTTIEGLPAGVLEYSLEGDRAGRSYHAQCISYILVYGTTNGSADLLSIYGRFNGP